MKKNINILLACLIVLGMVACDKDGGIDSDIFKATESAALATWVTSPKTGIKLSNPTSTATFEVEFLDETDGSSVEAFTMTVTDKDDKTRVLLNQTTFSANTNGNKGFSGSISMNAIATALGTTVASYSEGDEFDFVSTITRGGTVFPSGNSLSEVKNFTLTLPVETVGVAVTIKKSILNANGTTVDMVFTESLNRHPSLTVIKGGGRFSVVIPILDVKMKDSAYRTTYTPGTVEEKVSFTITGASAFATGFEMAADTLKDAFTIDLTDPMIVGNDSDTTATGGQRYILLLDEVIGSVTLKENFTGVDDDGDGDDDEVGEGKKVDVTFTGAFFDFEYEWADGDGEVTLTLEVKDVAGNEVALPADLATVVLN